MLTAGSNHAVAFGLIDYRHGRFQHTIDRLAKVDQGGLESLWRSLVLALAYHDLGESSEAEKYLQRGVHDLEQMTVPAKRQDASRRRALPWHTYLELRLLRREAEAVILGKP